MSTDESALANSPVSEITQPPRHRRFFNLKRGAAHCLKLMLYEFLGLDNCLLLLEFYWRLYLPLFSPALYMPYRLDITI